MVPASALALLALAAVVGMIRDCPHVAGLRCLAQIRVDFDCCDDCEGALEHRLRSEWNGSRRGQRKRGAAMSTEEKIAKLMARHYAIMGRPRFWYEPQWKEASKRLCVMASNLRMELRGQG